MLSTSLGSMSQITLDAICKTTRPFTPILHSYVYLLLLALDSDADRLEDVVLVDYGGGSGLQSSLARAAGVGTVIYTDIYDVACHDARVLGRAIGHEADEYLLGDQADVLAMCRKRSPEVTAVTSYDVIEHVYDVDSFFADLPRFSKRAIEHRHGVLGKRCQSADPPVCDAGRSNKPSQRIELRSGDKKSATPSGPITPSGRTW